MLRDIKIDLQLQPLIAAPPMTSDQLYKQACSSDEVTINTWRKIWKDNYVANKERFGSFADHSWASLFGINRHKPCIVIGSGPSLKYSIEALKKNQAMENPVMTVSCLHNLSYFVKEGIEVDYYLSLDAGKIVTQDAVEMNGASPDYYWEKSKGKKLLAYAASDPELFDKWQGEIYLFNAITPDLKLKGELEAVERFTSYVSSGGNAGGACTYFAKIIASSNPLMFVGFDFCFSYENQFHAYPSQYDNFNGLGIGNCVRWPDVYGNMRSTWNSYLNFKFFMDSLPMRVPGDYISCSEGIMGAYREGNIAQFQYKTLDQALAPYQLSEKIVVEKRQASDNALVGSQEFILKEIMQNPNFEHDLTVY